MKHFIKNQLKAMLTVTILASMLLTQSVLAEAIIEAPQIYPDKGSAYAASATDDESENTSDNTDDSIKTITDRTITSDGSDATPMPFSSTIRKAYCIEPNTNYSVSSNSLPTSQAKFALFVMPVDGYVNFAMNGADANSAKDAKYLNAYVRIKKPDGTYTCMLHGKKLSEAKSSYTSPNWGLKKGSVLLFKLINQGAVLPYTFSFTVTPSDTCEKEYNGAAKYANSISANIAYHANFYSTDAYDYYTYTATKEERMCVKVEIDNDTTYAKSTKYWNIKAFKNDNSLFVEKKVKLSSASNIFTSPSFTVNEGDVITFYLNEGTAPIGVNYTVSLSTDIQEFNVVTGQKIKLRNYLPDGTAYTVPISYKKLAKIKGNPAIATFKKPGTVIIKYRDNRIHREAVFNIETPQFNYRTTSQLSERGASVSYYDLVEGCVLDPINITCKKNKSITIDDQGLITAVSGGKATILATYGSEAFPKVYKFKFNVPCTTLTKNYAKIKEGKVKKINIKNIGDKNIVVSPVDGTIATAELVRSGNGNNGKLCITGNKAGTTDIYVISNGVDYSCKVDVLPSAK